MSTSPAATDGATATPIAGASVWKRVETLVKNLVCLVLWIWLACRVFGLRYPLVQPHTIWDLVSSALQTTWSKVFALGLLGVLAWRKRLLWSGRFALGFVFRFVWFPLIAAYYAIVLPRRTFKLVAPPVNTLLGHIITTTVAKASIVLLLLFAISTYILLSHQSRGWIDVGIVLLYTSLLVTFRVAVFWTGKPLVLLEQLLHIIYRIMDWALGVVMRDLKPVARPEDAKKSMETAQTQFSWITSTLSWCEAMIANNSDPKTVVGVFVGLLFVCVAVAVIAFGLIYYSLVQLDPQAFVGSMMWSIGDCLFKSLIVITTSGDIVPITTSAKLNVAAEILTGIWLLGWLVFQYSVVSIPQVVQHRSDILGRLAAKRQEVAQCEATLHRTLFPELAVEAPVTLEERTPAVADDL